MAVELFIVPMVVPATPSFADPIRPKYVKDPAVNRWGSIRYSTADDAIVLIDATQVYLDSVAGESDAFRIATEANIDNTLNAAQVTAARTFFEVRDVPGEFVNIGDTRREVIRGVVGMFLFSQRLEGAFGVGFREKFTSRGMTLDSTWQDFPQVLKDEFLLIRDDHGWTNTELGVTNASTLRQILKAVSDQFENTPIVISQFEI